MARASPCTSVTASVRILVDSCLDKHGIPGALRYLESIGLDPAQAVALSVATHWHDDHIRGMARLVEACGQAAFCCAGALSRKEFLAAVHALEDRHLSVKVTPNAHAPRSPRKCGEQATARGIAALFAIEREGWGREGAGAGGSARRLSPHVGEVVDQFVPNMMVRKQTLVPELKGRGPRADAVFVQQRRKHVMAHR